MLQRAISDEYLLMEINSMDMLVNLFKMMLAAGTKTGCWKNWCIIVKVRLFILINENTVLVWKKYYLKTIWKLLANRLPFFNWFDYYSTFFMTYRLKSERQNHWVFRRNWDLQFSHSRNEQHDITSDFWYERRYDNDEPICLLYVYTVEWSTLTHWYPVK